MMDRDGLAQDLPDAHLGVQRGIEVLEDHLHLAPELPELIGVESW